MSIKTVQSYSVQANGLRDYIPETIFTPAGDTWKRNPAWLPMTGFNYSYDSTFSLGTGFTTDFDADPRIIVLQSDGKILIGGNFTSYNGTTVGRLVRLNTNGSLDSSFNTNIGSGASAIIRNITIQPDGKILVVGDFGYWDVDLTGARGLVRLNSDGTRDSSFNIGTGFGSGGIRAIAVQSDGKILIGGGFISFNGTSCGKIIRLNTDGSVDTSFVADGTISPGSIEVIKIKSNKKIVVGGTFTSWQTSFGTESKYGLIQLNENGSVDTTFNQNNSQVFYSSGSIGVNDLAFQPDEKIIVVGPFYGVTYGSGGPVTKQVIRINSDGTYDDTFVIKQNLSDGTTYKVKLLSDGKILLCGYDDYVYNGVLKGSIIRLYADGNLDTSFSLGTGFTYSPYAPLVFDLAVQTDGKILAVGSFNTYQGTTRNKLVRLNVTEEKVSILKAVYANSDFASFKCAGNYTINWGDGNTENFTSGTQANHQYDYANTNLDDTNGPVTFTDAGDLVTRTYHGYANNDIITFSSITNTTGINISTPYYVANSQANTFQLSASNGGSILTLTTDGTGTLLPYKQVLITITPQAGANLTQALLHIRNTQINTQYESGFLDMGISIPNINVATNFGIGTTYNGSFIIENFNRMLESVNILNYDKMTNASTLFYDCYSLKYISQFNTANVTDMNNMFYNCLSLKSVPLFNTANVTIMSSMFRSCYSLKTVPLFNTVNVINMGSMFQSCYSLQSVPLFNTANVVTMSTMFQSCRSLQSVPLFNTAKVTTMVNMFDICHSLQSVPLFNTANVTTMSQMFTNCVSLKSVPLFDTAKVINMNFMFQSCRSLQSVPLFNTANVTTMSQMFDSCYSLQSVPLFNTSKVTSMASMFTYCYSLRSVPLFDTANVITMSYMFYFCYSLKTVPLFNTVKVTDMSNMFYFCYSLQSVPQFNTDKVIDMSFMFQSCRSLQSVPLFNTANVTTMSQMFDGCYSLRSVPLFNTANVTNMGSMFNSCYSLRSVPLFDTSKVTNMGATFFVCSSLKTVPLFNTANVTIMGDMFNSCYSLQSVPQFNTAKVTSMSFMFQSCYSLQSVPPFDTANVITMSYMFYFCSSLKTVPLFNTNKVTNMSSMFFNCYALRDIPSLNCASVSSSSGFASMFSSSKITRSQLANTKYSIDYSNNLLSNTSLNEIYTNLPTVTGQTITVTGNWGRATDDPTIATAKGWTVTG